MENYLFVIPLSGGKELMGVEVDASSGFYHTALYVMNAAREEYPDEDISCCQVWNRVDANTMKLLITVYAQ